MHPSRAHLCMPEAKNLAIGLVLLLTGLALGSKSDEVLDALGRQAESNETLVVPLPHRIEVFGESVDLKDRDMAECLSRELHANTYWHSNTLLMLQRRGAWEAPVRQWLREEGVPEDFVFLLAAESGFQPKAFSPSGAAGFWEFMAATGGDGRSARASATANSSAGTPGCGNRFLKILTPWQSNLSFPSSVSLTL